MKERLAKLLDYMTEEQARNDGFTHHGGMYGIPCWVGDPYSGQPMVAAKWGPLEHIITLGHWVTGLQINLLGLDPHFQIQLYRPIDARASA